MDVHQNAYNNNTTTAQANPVTVHRHSTSKHSSYRFKNKTVMDLSLKLKYHNLN